MNLAGGNSAAKQHWSKGSVTACNKKMSVNKLDSVDFNKTLESYPEYCCVKCVARFNLSAGNKK